MSAPTATLHPSDRPPRTPERDRDAVRVHNAHAAPARAQRPYPAGAGRALADARSCSRS